MSRICKKIKAEDDVIYVKECRECNKSDCPIAVLFSNLDDVKRDVSNIEELCNLNSETLDKVILILEEITGKDYSSLYERIGRKP